MQYALNKYINTAVKLRLVATDGEMRRSMEHGGAHLPDTGQYPFELVSVENVGPSQKLTYNHYVKGTAEKACSRYLHN